MAKTDIDVSMGAAASEAQRADPVLAGDVHVLANNFVLPKTAGLFHTVRKADGTWLPFSDVKAQAGDPGGIKDVASATIAGQLHVLVATDSGGLSYTTRRVDGSWANFRNIKLEAGDPGKIEAVAAANVSGVLHVGVVADGINSAKLMHTVMASTGAFIPFGDVESVAGDIGTPHELAMAGRSSELHLAVVTISAGNNRIRHTIRKSNGSWQQFVDVGPLAGDLIGEFRVALAADSKGGLHLAAVANFRLFHTIRQSNGVWLPFGDVEGQTGDVGQILEVALARAGTGMHLFAGTGNGPGGLLHTMRLTNGEWLSFGDVEGPAGELGSIGTFSVSPG